MTRKFGQAGTRDNLSNVATFEDLETKSRKNLLALDEPIVVLTGGRSGSTLLRVLLDAHPELACPPETNIVMAIAALGRAWQLTSPQGANAPLSRLASTSLRASLNTVFTDYLLRHGKRRWCDKSLGTVRGLGPFIDLYPKTQFISLHRHCMDVINSGLEASPFGLLGYGYENYATRFGGNSVAAIAAAWCEETTLALEFEEAHPEKCHRVYYEALVEQPETVAADLFSFLGVERAPGISEYCFDVKHDFSGPGDYKVSATSSINADSIGRGIRVPVSFIPPGLLDTMNGLLERLGYAVVDEDWKRSIRPPALLPGRSLTDPALVDQRGTALLDRLEAVVNDRVRERLAMPVPPAALGAVGPTKRIGIAAYSGNGTMTRCWQLDLNRGTSSSGNYGDSTHAPRVDWLVSGDAQTWLNLLSGDENIAVSMRLRKLRYVSLAPSHESEATQELRDSRNYMMMIKHLLDLGETSATS